MRGLFSFRGRASRLAYVGGVLAALLGLVLPWASAGTVGIGLELAIHAVLRAVYPEGAAAFARAGLAAWLMILVGTVCAAASFWLLAAMAAKRLQDLGLSGWHFAWLVALSLLGEFAQNGVVDTAAALIVSGALLLLALLPGTRGANRYGPSPGLPTPA